MERPPQQYRVLFITRKWPPAVGGMETYCVELTNALRRLADLDIWALPGKSDGRAPSAWALLLFGVKTFFRLMLMRRAPDAIHVADLSMWPIALIARLRHGDVATVMSAHGTDAAFSRGDGISSQLYRVFLQLGARLTRKSRVIANSTATSDLVRTLGFTDVVVSRLAATPDFHALPPTAPEDYVLFVGRLIDRKGCGWFAREVLPMLPESMTLKVAAPTAGVDARCIVNAPRIDYLGAVHGDELANLRRRALAVIAPNLESEGALGFEGFGLTIVEAAAAGGVCLAADVDGMVDAIIDGQTGFTLASGDARAWRDEILSIADWSSSARAAFIRDSVALVEREFSWERVAQQTLAAYKSANPSAPTVPASLSEGAV